KTICCYSSQLQTIGVPMSNEQTAARHSALTLAVQFGCTEDVTTILHNADLFLSFLNRGDDVIAKPAAKPVKAAKPVASKPAPEPEPEVEADEAPAVTDKEVGEALGAMLAA